MIYRTQIFFALVISGLLFSAADAERARYRLDVVNTWSTTTHPGLFPTDAHFSWLAGGLHNSSSDFWEVGQVASPGMVQMAETGFTMMLVDEIDDAVAAGTAGSSLHWDWWFCPGETNHGSCGSNTVEIEVDSEFPLITLATMLGPSPDWFVGTDALPLRDANGWLPSVTSDAVPYDAGTRSSNAWQLFGPQNNPPEPISLITSSATHLVGPDSLGSFNFTQIPFDCDFDGDLDCDFDDINALLAQGDLQAAGGAPVTDPKYDLNSDNVLDGQDIQQWLADAAHAAGFDSPFRSGDANLDGTVDVSDFNAWNGNKFSMVDRWDLGEFTGDGFVDTSDFNEWNNNKFTASDVNSVPEPSMVGWLLFLVMGLVGRRRVLLRRK